MAIASHLSDHPSGAVRHLMHLPDNYAYHYFIFRNTGSYLLCLGHRTHLGFCSYWSGCDDTDRSGKSTNSWYGACKGLARCQFSPSLPVSRSSDGCTIRSTSGFHLMAPVFLKKFVVNVQFSEFRLSTYQTLKNLKL